MDIVWTDPQAAAVATVVEGLNKMDSHSKLISVTTAAKKIKSVITSVEGREDLVVCFQLYKRFQTPFNVIG